MAEKVVLSESIDKQWRVNNKFMRQIPARSMACFRLNLPTASSIFVEIFCFDDSAATRIALAIAFAFERP